MKLYIAGPMTGYVDLNYPAFKSAEALLVQAGFEVLNPVDNDPGDGKHDWLDFMRMSLVQISQCDGIAILPGWAESRGARIEVDLVRSLGLPVKYVEEWLS